MLHGHEYKIYLQLHGYISIVTYDFKHMATWLQNYYVYIITYIHLTINIWFHLIMVKYTYGDISKITHIVRYPY